MGMRISRHHFEPWQVYPINGLGRFGFSHLDVLSALTMDRLDRMYVSLIRSQSFALRQHGYNTPIKPTVRCSKNPICGASLHAVLTYGISPAKMPLWRRNG